jgi:Cu-Zn family superoxide dismutase
MGSHLGDLPNVTADAQGDVGMQLSLDQLPAQLMPEIFDADGTAIVVHAAADDYRTDPSGNSGGRIACGVLRKP